MDNKVTVVILNWNGKKWLEQFLPFVMKTTYPWFSVLLVDNGSEDDSLVFVRKHFPGVQILPLDRNYGFAEGNNKALRYVETPYVALLNSDVEVTPDWLEPLVEELDTHPEVAAVQPKIRAWRQRDHFEYAGAAGGFLDKLGYPFCRGRMFDQVEEDQGQYDQRMEIFWASGACCLIRKSAIDAAGGLFDPDFFAHMEEIDFCWRLHNFGYKVSFRPESVVYHVGGGTLPQGNPRKTYLNVRNNLIMMRKNLPTSTRETIIFIRMLMDYVWGIKSLFTGDAATITAIFRGHRDYLQNRSKWMVKTLRIYNAHLPHKFPETGFYNGSIVWQYFVRGKKKWSSVFKDFS